MAKLSGQVICNIFAAVMIWSYIPVLADINPPVIKYNIDVSLDVENKFLNGKEKVIYISGADKPLEEIYLHLYANAYRDRHSIANQEAETKMHDFTLAHAKEKEKGFINVEKLLINGNPTVYEIDDTSMRVKLVKPLLPGDSLVIDIDFVTKIPAIPHRFRYYGKRFAISQWYPKIAVYDKKGWHHDYYHLLGEFYGDFATFDVSINLPQNYYIGATGYLANAIGGDNDMPSIIDDNRLIKAKAKKLDDQVGKGIINSSKTLVFHAENAHDFAWVASPDYLKKDTVWNGIKVTTIIFDRDRGSAWKNLMDYSLDALTFYSEQIGPYPYPYLTVVEAYTTPIGGMEYPMLSMIDPGVNMPLTRALEYVTIHEIGHNWWYGAIANDELNEPWLDEGFNEYFTVKYAKWKYDDGGMFNLPNPIAGILQMPYGKNYELYLMNNHYLRRDNGPVAQPAYKANDIVEYSNIVYGKGSIVLNMLSYVIGDSLFSEIIRKYYSEYKFKHPSIDDFVEFSERVSGQELDWFFDEWLYTNKTCNYAVGKISESALDSTSGDFITQVEIKRNDDIIMPVEVAAISNNGGRVTQRTFCDSSITKIIFRTQDRVARFIIDPNNRLLETSKLDNESGHFPPIRLNGIWRLTAPSETDNYGITMNPYLWYNKVDKLKVGALLMGGYAGVKHLCGISASYGTRTKDFNYGFNYSNTFPVLKDNQWGFSLYNGNGMRGYGIGISHGESQVLLPQVLLLFHPIISSHLRLRYSDKYDSRYFDKDWYSTGRTSSVLFNIGYIQRGYQGLTKIGLALERGISVFDANYSFSRLLMGVSQDFYIIKTGALVINLKGSVGRIWGNAPLQEKLHIGSGVPSSTVDPYGMLFTSGGGGVRGYNYEPILGNELYAINLKLKSERMIWKPLGLAPSLFLDFGRLNDGKDDRYLRRSLYDAGVEIGMLGVVYWSFPIWMNVPVDGHKEFHFRVVLGIGSGE